MTGVNGGGGIIRKGGMVAAIFWGMPRGWIDSLPDIFKRGKRLLCNLLGGASVLHFGNFSGAFQPMSAPRFFLNGMIVFRSGSVRRNLKCRAGFACVLMPRKESSALIGIGGDGFYCKICIIKRCLPCPPRETPSAFSFFLGNSNLRRSPNPLFSAILASRASGGGGKKKDRPCLGGLKKNNRLASPRGFEPRS